MQANLSSLLAMVLFSMILSHTQAPHRIKGASFEVRLNG